MDDENYFMNYDGVTGAILGFYLLSIHGVDIPTPNISITPAKHNFYMEHNGMYHINITTLADELIPVVEIPTVKTDMQILQEKQALILGAIDDIIFGGTL